MAEGNVAVGRDAHETEAGTTRVRLAHALVDLLQRVAHVREAVMSSGERVLEELLSETLELAEHRLEAVFLDRVVTLPRRRHRREADLPEADLVPQVKIDRLDVEVLFRQCHTRAHRPPAVPLEEHADVRQDDVVAPHPVVAVSY